MIPGAKTRAVFRGAVATALVLTALLGLGRASAQEWVVVPATTDERGSMNAVAEGLRDALTRAGVSVVTAAESAKRFEAHGSAPPIALRESEIAAWAERSKRALGYLARRDYEAALGELHTAQALSRSSAEALNRDPDRAELLLDTCLYTVRALLGVGRRSEAQAEAKECARLSLHATPNAVMHPPDVRTFYRAAVEAGPETAGGLSVTSEPSGCDVRINGLARGRTPLRTDGLMPGRYRVQVSCDEEQGRVHPVDVESANTELHVNARFDRVIRSGDRLELDYATAPGPSIQARDGRLVAQASLARVVLLTAPSSEIVELTAMDAEAPPSAFARLAVPGNDPGRIVWATAVEVLVAGTCKDLTAGDGPAPVDCVTGEPIATADAAETLRRPPRGQFVAGVTLAAFGTAALASGYALYGVSSNSAADAMVQTPSNDNQARWLNLRFGMFYTGSAGAGALVAAMPLALPYRAKTPWWAWLSGGVGVALVGTAIALAVTAPPTPSASRVADPQGYVDRANRTDPAFLVGVTAAPLLTMPLVFLLRRDGKRPKASLSPHLAAGRQGGLLGIRGQY